MFPPYSSSPLECKCSKNLFFFLSFETETKTNLTKCLFSLLVFVLSSTWISSENETRQNLTLMMTCNFFELSKFSTQYFFIHFYFQCKYTFLHRNSNCLRNEISGNTGICSSGSGCQVIPYILLHFGYHCLGSLWTDTNLIKLIEWLAVIVYCQRTIGQKI